MDENTQDLYNRIARLDEMLDVHKSFITYLLEKFDSEEAWRFHYNLDNINE